MPAMATFDDSAGYAEPLPVAHRHPGARVARRADKRPAAAFLPESRKKCGHCQDMKPCVEFSADVSRGDGLRGWCKMCEAEARSNRYKKRKAAAIEHSVSRRRLEQPLGGLPSYHQQQQQPQQMPQQRAQAPPPPGAAQPPALQRVLEMYAAQNPGVALPPHLQQLLQQAQLQQQHAAMLDHQAQAHRQQPQQQQQQPAMPLALLQQQMAMWQAQKAAAARASAAADAPTAQYCSAFHPVSPSPQGGPLQQPASAAAISAALGGALNGSSMSAALQGRPQQHQQQQPLALPSGEALAAYLAAEAATGNINGADGHATAQTLASIVPRLMPGYSAAMVQDQAAAAKAAAAAAVAAAHRPASPATSDSELSAGEILTGMKHHGGGGGGGGFSPWGAAGGGLRTASASRGDSQRGNLLSRQRREPALWRGSAGSEDSGLVSVPAAAAARPPSELQVPRRSRTRPPAVATAKPDRAAVDRPVVAAAAAAPAPAAAATPPESPPRPVAGRRADAKQPGVTHFSSQFLALLLTMRAVAFNSNSNSSGQRDT